MKVERKIKISNGNSIKEKTYYYWSEYDSYDEAIQYAKRIKQEWRQKEMNIKYFILESQEGLFLKVPVFVLYFTENLRTGGFK